MTADQVSEIVARASSLRERLEQGYAPTDAPNQHTARSERLALWRRLAAKGSDELFARRLACLKTNRVNVEALLGDVRCPNGSAAPPWTELLLAWLDAFSAQQQRAQPERDDRRDELQCEAVLASLADLAETADDVNALSCFTPAARAALRETLLERTSRLASPVFCRANQPGVRQGGLESLLLEYSVLARLLCETALSWIRTTSELSSRIIADYGMLTEAFGNGNPLGRAARVEHGLSDAHDGGRTVVALTFESGAELMYKPRGLWAEASCGRMIDFLNSTNDAPQLRLPRTLDRGEYGWQERVHVRPCRDVTEVETFYERAGALLAFVYAVGGLDLHSENIIACGPWPIPIDLETIFQPRVKRRNPPAERFGAVVPGWLYERSVMRTGLLPLWQAGPHGAVFDCSGLSGTGAQTTPVGTAAPSRAHLPILDGRELVPDQHLSPVLTGFTRMYRALQKHQRTLIALNDAGDESTAALARFLVRPSTVYESVLRQSLEPEALRNGAQRSIRLEALSRGMLIMDSPLQALLGAELASLERLDIPCFRVPQTSYSLTAEGCAAEDCFDVSARDAMLQGFSALSEEDLFLQRALVRNSFGLRFVDAPVSDARTDSAPDPLQSELLVSASAIAEELIKLSVRAPDGAATWFCITPMSRAGPARMSEMSSGLYAGAAGTALFLGSFARITGDARARTLCLAALRPLSAELAAHHQAASRGIGMADGVAGSIFALTRCGVELREAPLLRAAEAAARAITPQVIQQDRRYDLLYGSAGAALALLVLHELCGLDWILERAARCARHLITQGIPTQNGRRAWKTMDACLTGAAHGSAGIALALCRVGAATGDATLIDAAVEAVDHEDDHFSRDAGNWVDLRASNISAPNHSFGESWCHGAPGILACRLGMLQKTPDVATRHLDAALEKVRCLSLERPDSLCCGNAGIIDTMLQAGTALHDPGLIAHAYRRAEGLLERAGSNRDFSLASRAAHGTTDPTLFQGIAGIGYTLLRLATPVELPSVLLFDSGARDMRIHEVERAEHGGIPQWKSRVAASQRL
jgi:type 2 lantibiotic biosynthesis protein LanM